jgi:ABC-2 type transport system permease protein
MGSIFRKARTLLSVYNALMVEVRSEIFLWMLATAFPLILMGVWIQAGQSGKFSLGPGEFAQYFTVLFVIRQFTIVWVIYDFEFDVTQGRLSPFLLQPLDPVWRYIAAHTAERATRFPFVFAALGAVLLLVPQARWSPSAMDIVMGVVVVYLAFVLRFLIQYTFAMLAFWTERASGIEHVWFMAYLFLSGLLGPLDVYSPSMRAATDWTPFPLLIYYPAQVLLGREVNLVWVVGSLLGWSLAFFMVNRWLWRVSLRRYSGMGA